MSEDEVVTYFGGPHDGETVLLSPQAQDGQKLVCSCVGSAAGFYLLTTYPHGPSGRTGRRRLWSWWNRPLSSVMGKKA